VNTPLAVPIRSPIASEMRDLSAEVLTTLAGVIAAVAVVGLNMGLESALDLDLLGLTYWFVLPVGALFGGFGAASGYYAAARATQRLPNRRMLFEMLAIGFSTCLVMHWVDYATLRLQDGTPMRNALPFWQYFQLRTEHLQLVTQGPSGSVTDRTSELGLLGYAHELLQIAGFLCGALVMWLVLRSHEACAPCSRYARTTRLLQRAPTEVFDSVLSSAGIALPQFPERVAEALGKRRLIGLSLNVATCPSCRRSWLRPAAVGIDGTHPVVRPMAPYDLSSAQATELLKLRT